MQRCPECPGINNCVPPDGPQMADLMFIGEAPGKEEDRRKLPFVGKTGDEVNRGYLPICNLRRENVMITNAIKCLPPGIGKLNRQRDKDMSMLRSCAECHLYREIEVAQPRLLIPMGSFACYALDPEIDLELQHGMPLETRWGPVFPMYHPAGGIHEPKKMLQIRTDWTRLAKHLKGRLRIPTDPFEGKEQYDYLEDPSMVTGILSGYTHSALACDTESTRQRDPFCLTFSSEAGTGFLIRAESKPTLGAFQQQLDRWKGPILFHNWLYDRAVVRRMGLRFPEHKIHDTMVTAFQLGNIPQGLKALAYRELGMVMQDFDDLVTPHSRKLVLEYYRQALCEIWGKPDPQLVRDSQTGRWKEYKPQSFNAKIKRFFNDYTKNPDKDVFEMWTKNWEASQAEVQERLGPWPGKCITHAAAEDWPAVVRYACRDADATLRLYPVLQRMVRQVRQRPQELWNEMAA